MRDLLTVVVAKREQLAPDIVALELSTPDGSQLPAFEPGAHIEVRLDDGKTRPYSLCGDPAQTKAYRLGVLRVQNSTGVSQYLCRDLKVGDSFQISPPRNLFPLEERAVRSVLIGGGIGITPLMAMARRLRAIGADFSLHYCVRTMDRAVFAEEMLEAGLGDHLHLHLSQDRRFSLKDDFAQLPRGTHVYVCGPQGLMDQVIADARLHGCVDAQIHMEYFDVDTNVSGESFVVQTKNGAVLNVGADQRIADVLIAHGYDIEVSCEKGICGSCVVTVLEGEVDHRDHYLTEEERCSQITVCCSRSLTPALVLDI